MPVPVLLVWVLSAALSPVVPREGDLVRAAGDEVELERVATRLGPARLLRLAAQGGRARAAALRGLALAGGGRSEIAAEVAAQALLPLCELLVRTRDPRTLQLGALAAERLARRLGGSAPLLSDRGDLPGDELPRAAALLLRLAGDESLEPAARAELLAAASALPGGVQRDPAALVALARGGPGPVQEEALAALLRLGADGRQVLRGLALASEDPLLSAGAAASLCDAGERDAELLSRARALAAQRDAAPMRRPLGACLRRAGKGTP